MTIATQIDATTIATDWTRMWNREFPASDIVSVDARVHFGRTPRSPRPATMTGPAELQAVVDGIGATIEGVHYALQGDALLDRSGHHVTIVWNVRGRDVEPRTGIDVLRVDDSGMIVEVWSVTGDLLLPPLS